jgi:hypothetical protein
MRGCVAIVMMVMQQGQQQGHQQQAEEGRHHHTYHKCYCVPNVPNVTDRPNLQTDCYL